MLLKDPRIQLSISLLLIYISSILFSGLSNSFESIKHLLFVLSFTILFDLFFLRLRRVDFFIPAAALTTGLIISILLPPSSSVIELIFASALAMFSKNFVKGSNRHIFNPAGLGVLATALIFGHSVSWWAASFQPPNSIYFLILLTPLLVSQIRLKRFPITIPFLLTYSFLIFILNKVQFLNALIDPTVLFFSLVMLPEPQTTPNKKYVQIFFGVFVAFIAVFSSKFILADPLIFALLAGNLLFYRLK